MGKISKHYIELCNFWQLIGAFVEAQRTLNKLGVRSDTKRVEVGGSANVIRSAVFDDDPIGIMEENFYTASVDVLDGENVYLDKYAAGFGFMPPAAVLVGYGPRSNVLFYRKLV